MPLVTKEAGYPVDAVVAAEASVQASTAIVEKSTTAGRVLKSGETHPSLKDRSIINQTAWKVAATGAGNYAGDPKKWCEIAYEIQKFVEEKMLAVYGE